SGGCSFSSSQHLISIQVLHLKLESKLFARTCSFLSHFSTASMRFRINNTASSRDFTIDSRNSLLVIFEHIGAMFTATETFEPGVVFVVAEL
ncbi:hypothetical protein, partial [Burkholderia ubonensis]|uniref:hypothetical protein n=1 Tax=Burkholderia ubonensis TaxID=101571 RepID=UPI001E55AF56